MAWTVTIDSVAPNTAERGVDIAASFSDGTQVLPEVLTAAGTDWENDLKAWAKRRLAELTALDNLNANIGTKYIGGTFQLNAQGNLVKV